MGAPAGVIDSVRAFVGRLRYPQLFLLTGGLFILDLAIPDLIPFADEILLLLLTAFIGRLKERGAASGDRGGEEPPVKNVTPPGRR